MDPSLGFMTDVFLFFSVDLCYILWSLSPFDLHVALLELIAPLELYCASVSQDYLSFKLSGKVVFFHLFCHLSFYFFAPAAFILELHRCSKGRSISRVQTENCYYFRNGYCRRVRGGGVLGARAPPPPGKKDPLRNVQKRRESSAQICRQKMNVHVPLRYDKIKRKKVGKKEKSKRKGIKLKNKERG